MAANGRNASDQFAAHSMRPCRAQGAWRYPANRRRRPGRIISGCQQISRCGLLHPSLPLVPHPPSPQPAPGSAASTTSASPRHHASSMATPPWLALFRSSLCKLALRVVSLETSALQFNHNLFGKQVAERAEWIRGLAARRTAVLAASCPQLPYLACSRRALKRQPPPPAADATQATSMT